MFRKFYAVPGKVPFTTLGYGFAVYAIRKDDPEGARGNVVFITNRSLPDDEAMAMFAQMGIELREEA